MKEKKLIESEELNFLLQSGIILCKLAAFIVPDTDIQLDNLQVGAGESVQYAVRSRVQNQNIDGRPVSNV